MDEEPDGYDRWIAEQRLSRTQRHEAPRPRRHRLALSSAGSAVVPFVAIIVVLVGAMISRWLDMR